MNTIFPDPVRVFNDTDKSVWPDGEWKNEPDKVQWIDPATGLDCLIVRQQRSGHLCGYVGVPEGHVFFGVGYDSVDIENGPHGGLTFADKCNEDGRICHLPFPGRTDHVWWLGFDCLHDGDMSPGRNDNMWRAVLGDGTGGSGTYRTIGYVKRECEALARELMRPKEAVNALHVDADRPVEPTDRRCIDCQLGRPCCCGRKCSTRS